MKETWKVTYKKHMKLPRYLKQHHFTGPNYVEVDIDVSSDPIAKQISSSILDYTQCECGEEMAAEDPGSAVDSTKRTTYISA